MLFISRKVGESIIINESIRIDVQAIQGKGVKLSFLCPEGTVVLRQEIYDRICAENKAAETSAALIRTMISQE